MNDFYVEKHKKTSKPKLSEIKAEQAKLDTFISSLESAILFPATFEHDEIQARLQEQAAILNQTFFYFAEKFTNARMTNPHEIDLALLTQSQYRKTVMSILKSESRPQKMKNYKTN